MDRKIKVFISCLLIVIPVTTGVASFFVNHPSNQHVVKPIPELGNSVPTVVMHPTPTLYVFPHSLQAKKFEASAAAQKAHGLDLQASSKGIVIDHPTATIVAPTIYMPANQSVTPPTVTPTPEQAKVINTPATSSFPPLGGSAQSYGSSRSAFIIDNPSSMVINDTSLNTASNSFLQN